MICPYCQKEGKTSRLYPNGGTSTLALGESFYDEEGRWHTHDPNIHTSGWYCSNGHRWVEKTRRACPIPGCDVKGSVEVIRQPDMGPETS